MLSFSHSGKIGDLVYSLWWVRAMSRKAGFEASHLHLQTGVLHKFALFERDDIMLTESAASWIYPLLNAQGWLSISSGPEVPKSAYDLSSFRDLMRNFSSGDIRAWYLVCSDEHVDLQLQKQMLEVDRGSREAKGKVIICATERYFPATIDLRCLEPYKDKLLFLGLPSEHNAFEKANFKIDWVPTSDALHLAKLFKGSNGVIANLGGNFAIAEAMKVPRVLLAPDVMKVSFARDPQWIGKLIPGPCNVIPQGGWCDIAITNEKLVNLTEELLKGVK